MCHVHRNVCIRIEAQKYAKMHSYFKFFISLHIITCMPWLSPPSLGEKPARSWLHGKAAVSGQCLVKTWKMKGLVSLLCDNCDCGGQSKGCKFE